MRFNKTHVFAAVMAISLPALAQIVPPPTPPGARPAVIPPQGVASVNSAAQPMTMQSMLAGNPGEQSPAPQAESSENASPMELALPYAPPVTAQAAEAEVSAPALRPTAPGGSRVATKAPEAGKGKASTTATVKTDVKAKKIEAPVDPYAGIVGTPVSDSQLNRFVFPEPVLRVFFPEGSPLPECPEGAGEFDPCKPVFLNDQRMMLLQLQAGAKGPVQMLVHMKSGEMLTMNLMPSKGPGAIVRVAGSEDGASDERIASALSKNGVGPQSGVASGETLSEKHVALLSRIASGDMPAGFEPIKVAAGPIKFEHFEAVQMASWDNGAGMRAHLFQLQAYGSQPVALTADMFRHEAVLALALNKEQVTKTDTALLYILETAGEK